MNCARASDFWRISLKNEACLRKLVINVGTSERRRSRPFERLRTRFAEAITGGYVRIILQLIYVVNFLTSKMA